jgi:hypothetical protein
VVPGGAGSRTKQTMMYLPVARLLLRRDGALKEVLRASTFPMPAIYHHISAKSVFRLPQGTC